MITYDIFRDIQNQPSFWGFQGVFLFLFFGIVIFVMLMMIFVSSWILKFIILGIGIAGILAIRHQSGKVGVRGIKKIIGAQQQPGLLLCISPGFHLSENEKIVENEKTI